MQMRVFVPKSKFPVWPQMSVGLDIWPFMWRIVTGVTSESHYLYTEFLLRRAKQSERSRGNTVPIKGMTLPCQRLTRGAQETERLIDELLEVFMVATDTMNIPILDQERTGDIWSTQTTHTCPASRYVCFNPDSSISSRQSTKLNVLSSPHPRSTRRPTLHQDTAFSVELNHNTKIISISTQRKTQFI